MPFWGKCVSLYFFSDFSSIFLYFCQIWKPSASLHSASGSLHSCSVTLWNCLFRKDPFCQRQQWHYICPMHDFDQSFQRPGTGETAALVNFERPSLCCSSITVLFETNLSLSIFLWFFLLFYHILLVYAFEIAILGNLHFPIYQRHYICPTDHLDQLFLRSGRGETAGSVDFDGASVPSQNCCSSCSSITGPIS